VLVQYIHLWGVFIRPEECMGIMTDLGMAIMVAIMMGTMVVIIDLGMGTMAATIGDIMVDTMGADIMVDKTMIVGILVEEIGDSWV
jgi:hypothetical protein